MDDSLFDTSWTLYFVSNAKSSYRDLTSADQRALDRRAKQFREFVNINKPAHDSDSENERTGGLRECTWKPLRDSSHEVAVRNTAEDGVLVSLIYDKATYKFALCGSIEGNTLSLLLAKGPAATVKRFTNFLADAFHASVDPLRLPTALLQDVVEAYFRRLDSIPTPNSSPPTVSATSPSSQLLKTALGNLKVTITFSAPVAPQLKSLDLDIPPDTVGQFLESTQNGNARSSPKSILALVSQHLHNKTGLKIPVAAMQPQSTGTDGRKENEDQDAIMRISRITCAAFAISVEGRVKFATKAVEAAVQFDDVVQKANADMLRRIEEEAARRSRDG